MAYEIQRLGGGSVSEMSERSGRLSAILAREAIPVGISGFAASCLVPGQPHHRDGLSVMRRYPLLFVLVACQAVLVGLLVSDLLVLAVRAWGAPGSDGLTLLGGMSQGWRGVLNRFCSGCWHVELLSAVLALPPWLMLLNLTWAWMCWIVVRQSVSARWWLSALLGLVPLRLLCSRFFAGWAFWREDGRRVRAAEARTLQFSAVFAWVNGLSRQEMEDRWLDVLDQRLRDVADSYFSYLYVPGWISLGIVGLVGGALYFQVGWLFPVRLEYAVVCWMVYLTINRALLGLATFHWLNSPAAEDAEIGEWPVRAAGLLLASAVLTTGVMWF